MRYVSLPNGIPDASVLGLGCAAMMGSAGRRESLAALAAASDAGINFFDTARSYGYGASEGLLGEFFQSNARRDQVVLCTKFGILPAEHSWKQTVKPLARGLLKLFPALRGAARKQAGQLSSANHFSVAVLRASLETSLRELKTDYVDLLLMHAAPIAVLAQQDLLEELARLVAEGKVRMAGISGELDVIAATLEQRPPVLQTAQFACNLANFGFLDRMGAPHLDSEMWVSADRIPAEPGAPHLDSEMWVSAASVGSRPPTSSNPIFLVANHPFGGAAGIAESRRRIATLRDAPELPAELRAKLDPADPLLLPEVVLNAILVGTGIGAVVPAMIQPHHLQSNCRAIADCRFTPAELAQIRRALTSGSAEEPVEKAHRS